MVRNHSSSTESASMRHIARRTVDQTLDHAVPVVGLTISLMMLWSTHGMSLETRLFPQIVCVPMAILSIIELLRKIVLIKGKQDIRARTQEHRDVRLAPTKMLKTLSLMLLFLLFINYIGFYIALFSFLTLQYMAIDNNNKKYLIVAPTGVAVSFYVIFELLIAVPLPSAPLI